MRSARFLIALIVGALFDMPIAIIAAGYDSTHDGVNTTKGFHALGQLFGGTTNVLVLLCALIALAGLYVGQRILSRNGHHDAVPIITILMVVVAGLVGLHWIHVSVGMLVPFVAIVYLAVQTAVIGRIFSR